ncbi:(Fe-S)-binding protein [Cytobacillus kochii]|uniref:(Fe-S)-binding protein n=1 Tax=Cytobacillus kochii TaxID=859143 RepID=UPI00203D31CC|nr:(Fe-S)-binding protein [Cytobacillus kochii]MCM3324021.1 (Fe-S)-binding protein [Cytobacillus kochii]MCM3346575.1 (Fe-S)-binding protein [Cytobacillus kochii]MDM5206618.1 (Fe-S)-binding protein [Cytobacillus kochii]
MNNQLAYEETFDCVQCGYCLPACPTYTTMGKERHSPRGRINLVQMASEGKISIQEIEDSMELCLGCRACETACPTNVQYGKILSSYKEVKMEQEGSSLINRLAMKKGLANKSMLNTMNLSLRFYQQSGIEKLGKVTKGIQVLPENLRAFEAIIPNITKPDKELRKGTLIPDTETKLKVAFFTGCIMDVFFAKINDLSIKLLQHAGCEVTVIKNQTCCGALQHHEGDSETTKQLAKENIVAFEKEHYDYIVNSIGGCGAMLVEYDQLLQSEPEWVERAKGFAEKSKDISVILAELDIEFTKKVEKRITYQPSCHLSNVQKVKKSPLELIYRIPGTTYIPLPEMDMCCGSAGTYNVFHYQESMEILDEKMSYVKETIPEVIVTSNPGCHLQMCMGVKREGLESKVEVVHIVEILAEACGLKN